MKTIIIPWKMPGFNEMIEAAHKNVSWLSNRKRKVTRYVLMKDEWTQRLCMLFQEARLEPAKSIFITFTWVEVDCRRDPDNIAAAKKFILDALVTAGILKNDGWKQIRGWTDIFEVGHKAGVILKIE